MRESYVRHREKKGGSANKLGGYQKEKHPCDSMVILLVLVWMERKGQKGYHLGRDRISK
jgi:hypothetical protein